MNIGIVIIAFLFISSLAATVLAASTSSVNIHNSVNANSLTSSSTSVKSTSTGNARVENHISVEVNGEKKVIDDVKEGSSVNSNIKVEAKSENGKTSFNISGDPQSVKDVKGDSTQSSGKSKEGTNSSTQSHSNEVKKDQQSFWTGFSNFFKGIFSFFHFFSK
jgi:hypothetical protein